MNFLRKNILLILFFIVVVGYISSSVADNYDMIFFLKPFIVTTLLIHYLFSKVKKDVVFILALLSALAGDLLFSIAKDYQYMVAMGFFLLYSLFMMIIVSGRVQLIELKKILLSSIPFMVIIFSLAFMYFYNKNSMLVLYYIHAAVTILLGTFSLYYYITTKNRDALFFTLGCLFFIIGGAAKGFKFFYSPIIDAKVINIGGYALSLFFYYLAVTYKKE